MKRAVTGTALVALLLGVAYAPMGASTSQRAVVAKGDGCYMLDGDGGFIAGEYHSVTNNGGVSTFKCQAKKVNNSSKSNVTWDNANTGFMCGTALGNTADWRETISPSGNATLTCHAKN
jgi:hypothetical protein